MNMSPPMLTREQVRTGVFNADSRVIENSNNMTHATCMSPAHSFLNQESGTMSTEPGPLPQKNQQPQRCTSITCESIRGRLQSPDVASF